MLTDKGFIAIIHFFLIICAIVVVMVITFLRFQNPDMTDVRFFLTFWPLEVVLAGLVVAASLKNPFFRK